MPGGPGSAKRLELHDPAEESAGKGIDYGKDSQKLFSDLIKTDYLWYGCEPFDCEKDFGGILRILLLPKLSSLFEWEIILTAELWYCENSKHLLP